MECSRSLAVWFGQEHWIGIIVTVHGILKIPSTKIQISHAAQAPALREQIRMTEIQNSKQIGDCETSNK
jgi:hypothetical protein